MSNTYTVIGDPHLTLKSIENIERLTQQVEALSNSAIWLGDMLDTKEIIRGICLNFWIEYFAKSKLNHIILVGNHDWFNLECKDHSLVALSNLPNVTIVDHPMQIDGMNFVPYIHDQKELKSAIKEFQKDTVLFGHLEIKSFDFGNGHICEEGLTTKSFTKFKRVVSGHFHKYQEKGNLTYLGTPFSHTFGESNQTKYLGIYNKDSDSLELIETEFPRHITVEINCDKDTLQNNYRPEDHVRVILNGSQDSIDLFKMNNEKLSDVKVIERCTDEMVTNIKIEDTMDNEAQFVRWAKDIKELDEEIVKIGLDILGAVNGN